MRWAARLSLFLGSVVGALLVCELLARALLPPQQVVEIQQKTVSPSQVARNLLIENDGHIDSVIDWSGQHGIRLRPNLSVTIKNHLLSHQDVRIETNSLGLRSPELGKREAGEYRILVLGDSITLADYLDEEDSFPRILEERFAASGHPWVRVLNAGLPGASTRDEYYHYLELKEVVHPDLVLVAMYLNDATDSEKFYARTLRWPYSKSRLLTWLVNRLQIFAKSFFSESIAPGGIDPRWKEEFRAGRDLRSGGMFETKDGFDFEIYNAAMDFGLAWNPKSWEILGKMVAVFRDAALQSGSRFAMALLPVHLQVLGTVDDVYPQEQFTQMCLRLRIDCLDLRPILRQAAAQKEKKLYFDHCHMTAFGNAVVAAGLEAWLLPRLR
jgi:hypothetical protein